MEILGICSRYCCGLYAGKVLVIVQGVKEEMGKRNRGLIKKNLLFWRKLLKTTALPKNLICAIIYYSGFYKIYKKLVNREINGLIIFVYHNIEKEIFAKHVKFLTKRYKIISLSKAVELLSQGKNLKEHLAITFDDGYRNIKHIVNEITRNEIPICVYLTTDSIDKNDFFWWDKLRIMARQNKEFAIKKSIYKYEKLLKEIPQEKRDEKLNEILSEYASNTNNRPYLKENRDNINNMPLSWNDIKEIKRYAVEFGAHSHHHYILPNAQPTIIKKDIQRNKESIEKNVSTKCLHFAYPNGDYNREVIKILKEQGFISATTTKYGINTKNTSLFELYRIGINNKDWIPTVAVKISGLWNKIKKV